MRLVDSSPSSLPRMGVVKWGVIRDELKYSEREAEEGFWMDRK